MLPSSGKHHRLSTRMTWCWLEWMMRWPVNNNWSTGTNWIVWSVRLASNIVFACTWEYFGPRCRFLTTIIMLKTMRFNYKLISRISSRQLLIRTSPNLQKTRICGRMGEFGLCSLRRPFTNSRGVIPTIIHRHIIHANFHVIWLVSVCLWISDH